MTKFHLMPGLVLGFSGAHKILSLCEGKLSLSTAGTERLFLHAFHVYCYAIAIAIALAIPVAIAIAISVSLSFKYPNQKPNRHQRQQQVL